MRLCHRVISPHPQAAELQLSADEREELQRGAKPVPLLVTELHGELHAAQLRDVAGLEQQLRAVNDMRTRHLCTLSDDACQPTVNAAMAPPPLWRD